MTVENLFKCYISINQKYCMDYKKKSLSKLSNDASYEEIDTRLASGWYVDSVENNKKKKYRTKKVSFKISKKNNQINSLNNNSKYKFFYYLKIQIN